jgi:uncharacterized repeat protein (TIGR02543 family)
VKKRLLSFALAVALIAAIAPWSALKATASFAGSFQFDEDGKFTLMQIADIQSGVGVPARVTAAISDAISRYEPDLAVFTGDNVIESIATQANFRSVVNEIIAPLNNKNVKFAVTFGNHDDEGLGAPNKDTQYDYYKTVGGNNFVDHDIATLSGVGSGVIPIYPYGQSSGTPAYQVYLMDSGSDPSTGSYDACYTNQIDYYIQRSLTYTDVPSLWFQHVIVPDIYSRCMTTTNNGTGVSFTGNGSFASNKWYLDTARINFARSSSTSFSDIYNEAPAPCTTSLYEADAHRSSASYGKKTLYESWAAYGNLKGAYFGHDHLNEFTMTTVDGIDLGYGECTGLYKTLGVYAYNDNNPGVSIYELDIDGSYTTKFVAESDLATPVIDLTAPVGTWSFYAETTKNGLTYGFDNGTTDNVYIRMYSGNNATGTMLYQSADLAGTESGGNSGSITANNVPTTNLIKSIQIILPIGTDKWGCARVRVFFRPTGGVEQEIWNYDPDETTFSEGSHVETNITWFQGNNYIVNFLGNGSAGGLMADYNMVYGTSRRLTANAYTKPGYTFSGWSLSPVGGLDYANEADFTMGTANVTLYAKWTANIYTVGYNGNGSNGGLTADSEHTYDTEQPLSLNGYTRTNYAFAGWATKEDGGVEFTDGQPVLNLAEEGSVLLFAVWIYDGVSLAANAGSTTVIDETARLIYGLEPGITQQDFENRFVTISGNARFVYTSGSGGFGTGTTIELIDNNSEDVLFSYTVVIYGDVNGDGNVDSLDAGLMIDVENYLLDWNDPAFAVFRLAGDLNGDGNVDSSDAGLMIDFENYKINIDQVAGTIF